MRGLVALTAALATFATGCLAIIGGDEGDGGFLLRLPVAADVRLALSPFSATSTFEPEAPSPSTCRARPSISCR